MSLIIINNNNNIGRVDELYILTTVFGFDLSRIVFYLHIHVHS